MNVRVVIYNQYYRLVCVENQMGLDVFNLRHSVVADNALDGGDSGLRHMPYG